MDTCAELEIQLVGERGCGYMKFTYQTPAQPHQHQQASWRKLADADASDRFMTKP